MDVLHNYSVTKLNKMPKKTIWITTSILLIYFTFTSGLAFEVTKSEAINRLDIPYSIGLSAERTGINNITSKDDLECIMWLKENWDKKTPIATDYNGYCSIAALVPIYFQLNQGDRTGFLEPIPDKFYTELKKTQVGGYLIQRVEEHYAKWSTGDCYIFISSWNTEHQQYVEATGVGTKMVFPLPEFNYPVAKQCGDAVIYWKPKPPPKG